jgi:hypothetical protein
MNEARDMHRAAGVDDRGSRVGWPYTDANSYANPNSHAYADANAYADAYPNPNSHANTYPNAYAYPDADADAARARRVGAGVDGVQNAMVTRMKYMARAMAILILAPALAVAQDIPIVARSVGTVSPDSTGQIWTGKTRDYGNCWHKTVVDLNQMLIVTDYADLPIPGCPDEPAVRHLPEQNVRHISIEIQGDDGMSGLYFRGPDCMAPYAMGQWALIPQSNGTATLVMQGTRVPINMRNCLPK